MKLRTVLCSAAVLASGICAASTDTEEKMSLSDSLKTAGMANDSISAIVVTATRRPQVSRWVSDDHTVVQVEKESRTTSKSVGEMIADRVPAFMSDYGGGAAKKISLRGAGSERTLVLVDGKRVGTNDNDLGDLATEVISKAEVVEGGQSAVYGMDAVGGVVNLITRKPASDGTSGSFSSTIAAYEPNNGRSTGVNTNGNRAVINHKTGPFEGIAAGNWTFSDGKYDFASGPARYQVRDTNAFRNLAAFGRVGYTFDKAALCFTGSVANRIIQLPGSTTWPSPGTNRKNIAFGSADGSWKVTDYLTSKFTGSIGRDRIAFYSRNPLMPQNSTHLHFNGALETVQELTFNKQLVTVGAEYRRESMLSSDIGDHATNQIGAFAGSVNTLTSGVLSFQATPGVRFDYTDRAGGILNGKIGGIASAKVTFEPAVFFNAGTASRAPTMNDLFWPAEPYGIGNPDLKPEHSVYADYGIQFRSSAGPAAALTRLTAYQMEMKDMILWQPDPADMTGMRWTPVNKSEASIRGIRGSADLSFGKLFFSSLSAAWNDARDKETGTLLIYRPEYVVTFSEGVALGRVTAGLNCRYQSRVLANEMSGTYLPATTIFDARLGVRIFSSAREQQTAGIVYEMLNATNETRYANEGYPLPGREHRLSLKLDF